MQNYKNYHVKNILLSESYVINKLLVLKSNLSFMIVF